MAMLLNGDSFQVTTNGSGVLSAGSTTPSQTLPPFQGSFDISQESISRAVAKGNTREDILSAYQTFISGVPSGRGGQYAIDAQRRFGYASIRDAAAGYLQAAGLALSKPIEIVQQTFDEFVDGEFFGLPVPPDTTPTTSTTKSPIETLADVFKQAFGNAVFQPPLQTQAFGLSPVKTSTPQTGKSNIGTYVILGVIGVVIYFVYKRFKGQ